MYILANDVMYDWTIGLLESLREHDPELPVMVIPFDNRTTRLSRDCSRYGCGIVQDASLEALDRIGRTLADGNPEAVWIPMFRKLYSFWGPFDHALYLDADTVALESVLDVLRAFEKSRWDFCFFDGTDEYVYRSEAFVQQMKERHGAKLFNAGAGAPEKAPCRCNR